MEQGPAIGAAHVRLTPARFPRYYRTTGCDGDEYAGHRAKSELGTVRAGARDLPNIPPEPPPERSAPGGQ